jgi:hypothetical protein
MSAVKLLQIPDRVHTKDELIGLVSKLDFQNIVVIIEDDNGVTTLVLDGTTSERMNWMLDRAKVLLHRTG